MEHKIYIKENNDIVPYTLIYNNNKQIKSTHQDKKQRIYEIWENCYLKETNNKFYDLFVIKQHNPWINDKIIDSDEIKNNIYKHTQDKNNITEVYNINKELIITKFYDYYPCLIKSSTNWYPFEIYIIINFLIYIQLKNFIQVFKKSFKNSKQIQDVYLKMIVQIIL